MRVLVTFGKHPKTLAVVRSLGKANHEVIVADEMKRPLASFSKHCRRAHVVSSPHKSPTSFISDLQHIARAESIDLIIPMDDPECDLLSRSGTRSEFSPSIALPPEDAYWCARDKYKTYELCRDLGIRIPRTEKIQSTESALRISETLGFPFIVKPVSSSGSRGFRIIEDVESVISVGVLMRKHGTLIAQEYIPPGGSIGVSCLCDHGEMKACFAHRRIVEFPSSGGPSIVRESFHNRELELAACSFFESLRWHGIGMAEFRIDARTGNPYLMEVNPRFWGSLPLAIASGVDFPRLLCQLYETGTVPETSSYRDGVRCVNLLPFGLVSGLQSGNLGNLIRIIASGLYYRCFDVESLEDFMPTLGALYSMTRLMFDPPTLEMVLRR